MVKVKAKAGKKLKPRKKLTKPTKKLAQATKSKPKKKLSEVTTDEFFDQEFDFSDVEDDAGDESEIKEELDSDDEEFNPKLHKKSLDKLKETDPEFYKFLKANDKKLLNFDLSDEEDDKLSTRNEEDEESDQDDEKVHVPNENLEIASDESDYENNEEVAQSSKKSNKITLNVLKNWQEKLQSDKSAETIKSVVTAFHSAVGSLASSNEDKPTSYQVDGGAMFNGIVQLCILHLPAALKKFLKIGSASKFDAHKSKRFIKLKGIIKTYLIDLIKILDNVTSPDILAVLLKHLHQMIPYAKSFSALNKPLFRTLLKLWSTGDDTIRVVAFLNILQIATNRESAVLESLFKTMYIKYVENAKFVSPNTSPGINFMKHSLVEIYMLDQNLAYNHAFLYIRQLAIHLRNAITLQKKENFQTVYNWQFINSLRLWTELISVSDPQSMLRSLLYPLVQIITGTIKLVPTKQFYPLRFHCVQMLIKLSKETGVFIPILPFLTEVLSSYNFNQKHKVVTMKPISFLCLLRISKSQLQENGFKNSIIDNVYQLLLETAAKDSHTLSFPDVYVPCLIQLKSFLNNCKVAKFTKKMKQLHDKLTDNCQFIKAERDKVVLDLGNLAEIKNWENKMKNQGTPLQTFYDSWVKFYQSEQMKMLTNNDEIGDYKFLKNKKKRAGDDDHDSDLDMPVEEMDKLLKKQEEKKRKRKQTNQKTISSNDEDETALQKDDIVEDMTLADWE